MKNRTYRNILGLFLASVVLFASCEKEDPIKLDPQMATWEISEITSTTANVSGFVVAEGAGFTEHGICWNTAGEPTVSDATATADTVDAAIYVATATGLEHLTKYYVAAYVKTAEGTILYGGDTTFTTLAHIPTVSSVTAIADITPFSATSGGDVTYDGKADVTAKGVCWSLEPNPTIADGKSEDGTGIGTFTSSLTNLFGYSTYYVRAYATNEVGTAYSDNELEFTTLVGAPVVTTGDATDIDRYNAKLKGNAVLTGGADITERGFYWGTTENPTTADNTAASGSGLGVFEADISGLTVFSTYHVRAYAINSEGTSYGDDITFTTEDYPTEMYMIGDGVGDWEWDNTDLPMVAVNGHKELFWKIVWMDASGEFKFAPEKAWGKDFGKTGDATADVYAMGGENVPVPGVAGYYMVVVDLDNETIEVTDPQVFGMGDVFGSWTMGDHPFVVDNANEVIKYVGAAGSSNLRMYATASTMNLGGDWWRAEINIAPDTDTGDIVFRGNGGDPAAYAITAGQTISLNFKAGTGSRITP